MILKKKNQIRSRRANRVRTRITGTAARPRLSVFRSNKHMSVQLIDDVRGVTIASVHSKQIKEGKTKTEKAQAVGAAIAKKAATLGVKEALFDRGRSRYHGRVKSVAEHARENGLSI